MNLVLTEDAGKDTFVGASHRRLALLWATTAAVVMLHNTEEWLFNMTGWIAEHPWLPGRSLHGDQTEFAFVLAIVTIAVAAIAVTAIVFRPRWSTEVLACVAYALMANGASHLVLSLLSWSPMPGVFSGAIFLLPFGAIVVWVVPPVRWTISNISMTALAAIGITVGSFALAALFTSIG